MIPPLSAHFPAPESHPQASKTWIQRPLQPETPEGANPEGTLRATRLVVPRVLEGRCKGAHPFPEALAPSPSLPLFTCATAAASVCLAVPWGGRCDAL